MFQIKKIIKAFKWMSGNTEETHHPEILMIKLSKRSRESDNEKHLKN